MDDSIAPRAQQLEVEISSDAMRRTEIIILLRVSERTGVVQFADHQVTLIDHTIHTRVIADNRLNRRHGVVRQ